ncbi:unnamed protein product (macronuclear) [Paramecium tetraurelia]|uniref:Uncharacterized protein n=1 Tax=Paramecium tetraurelia TaxID=5888 RepID=A0C9Q1_PARTE|nr:uncharacterized protein GSPATT00006824001 [Paramecium tetraurelia]CAK67518.1 unnamed protein product [Paramecium tetraurelia]|eukprot:XP_001434915.1 hypothetical protein (macronuclear) [Paramecium tetraurelia strain d4-2]
MPNVKQYKSDTQISHMSTFTILCKINPINPPDTPKEIKTFKLNKDQQNQIQVKQCSKQSFKQDDSFIKQNENQYSEKYKRRRPILVARHSKSLSCIKKEKSVRFHLEKDESSFQFYIFQNWIQKVKKTNEQICSLKRFDEDVSLNSNGAKKIFEKIHKKYESKLHFQFPF